MEKILIVDDDHEVVESISSLFSGDEYEFVYDDSGRNVMSLLSEETIHLILLDVYLGSINGIDILEKVKIHYPEINIVMISGESDIETAITSVRAGAFDFIEKPFSKSKLKLVIKNSLADFHNRRKSGHYKKELLENNSFNGTSEGIKKIGLLIERVARAEIPVLITGENGTGKEIAARRIHYLSSRASMPFVAVNCAAIPKDLLESELFGCKKGAFTGAVSDREGLFARAAGGTLFLDEIGDMPLELQSKILRALQEREIRRVGDNRPVTVDIRLLSATNKNIQHLIANGVFREDLYYRVNGVQVDLLPLRERKDDLWDLAARFIEEFCYENNRAIPAVTDQAMQQLHAYDFPGNVRELKNIVQRTLVLMDGDRIQRFHLQSSERQPELGGRIEGSLREVKRQLLEGYLSGRLEALAGDRRALAEELGIHLNNLYRLLRECGR